MNELGKLPPQSIELEKAILGACMLEPGAFNEITEILNPESFYNDSHQNLFFAIRELHRKNKNIDLLTVNEQLMNMDKLDSVGGMVYLVELTQNIGGGTHIVEHALIVREKFIKREVIRLCDEAAKLAYNNENITDIREQVKKAIESTENTVKNNIIHISDVEQEYIRSLMNKAEGKGEKPIKTHFPSLNSKLPFGGFVGGDLILIGARPSVGKTAVALDMCKNITETSLFFSLEMTPQRLLNRMILSEDKIDQYRLRDANLHDQEWQFLDQINNDLKQKPIYFDAESKKLDQIVLTIKKAVRKFGIQIVFIDYLGLIQYNSGRNREQDISQISQALKFCAKEENVPIIALSQLNRESGKQRGIRKPPILTDLRDSGSLEQDADMVIFIHREDYEMDEKERGQYEDISDFTDLVIRKNRDGELGTVHLNRNQNKGRYWEGEENPFDESLTGNYYENEHEAF